MHPVAVVLISYSQILPDGASSTRRVSCELIHLGGDTHSLLVNVAWYPLPYWHRVRAEGALYHAPTAGLGRTIDLTTELSERALGNKLLDFIGDVYRQRPVHSDGRWLLHEPDTGFPYTPFLHIGAPISLSATGPAECGTRLASFLSSDLKLADEKRPRSFQIAGGLGLITEIERLQYEAYFAADTVSLASILANEIIPFVQTIWGNSRLRSPTKHKSASGTYKHRESFLGDQELSPRGN